MKYRLKAFHLFVCGFMLACLGGCSRKIPHQSGSETNLNTSEQDRSISKERIIMHDPASLQGQVHQVDTAMRFVPEKTDTLKKR